MPYIYKITNTINGKSYIGKTMITIEKRWREHCRDYKKIRCEKRPLYSAMKKYGINNFSIEEIEECNEDVLSQREMYWINYFNTYNDGYNATVGGDGNSYISHEIIIDTYNKTRNQREVSRLMNIDYTTVKKVLNANKIEKATLSEVNGTKVEMFSLDNQYIKTFISAREAARFISNTSKYKSPLYSHITDVCKGKRKTAYGYIWKYSN